MTRAQETQARLQEFLGRFNELSELLRSLEDGPKQFDTGVLLFRSETHTLQEIGRDPAINVTRLAARLGITKGAVSQTLAKLVRKKLVRKKVSPSSGREVRLELTALGWRGFHAHEKFHCEAFAACREYFGADLDAQLDATGRALGDLIGLVEVFKRRTRDVT
jgi:DNA-binding MarR family transcriptional regulator